MEWIASDALPLIPLRMLNEYVYCPRLAYLMWVQKEWADSHDTIRGKTQHHRVDKTVGDMLPAVEDFPEGKVLRSVELSDEDLGITGKLDIVEFNNEEVSPVDYKHGSRPDNARGYWDSDAVQIGAQAMLLQARGFKVTEGVIYYIASKERVRIPVNDELKQKVVEAIKGLRQIAAQKVPPPPLEDDNRCYGCSLVGICLPDEVNLFRHSNNTDDIRRLYPILGDALPVYVTTPGSKVGKSGDTLVIKTKEGGKTEVPFIYASQVALFGGVHITMPALTSLLSAGIPVCHFSTGGWFYGISMGMTHRNVLLRKAQFAIASDMGKRIQIARRLVQAKIKNSRTMIRRNHPNPPDAVLKELKRLILQAKQAPSLETLLGIEGTAAHVYYGVFNEILKPRGFDAALNFNFRRRNRRPPEDPVNALLSLTYSMLAKDFTVTLMAVGFDPFMGFYHQPRYGKPALALDLMEEFRSIIADSVVINLINNGEIKPTDFVWGGDIGVSLTFRGRKRVIEAYERRLDVVIKHPVFGYKVSYRKLLEVQSRLFARYITGEITEYPAVTPR